LKFEAKAVEARKYIAAVKCSHRNIEPRYKISKLLLEIVCLDGIKGQIVQQ